MSDPFASAAAYRAKGWVGTLPLPLGRKTPPPAGFTGDGGAWPSPADLADWAERGYLVGKPGQQRRETAPFNIALRLPPNVIALDVDDTAAFLALVQLVGPLPATWRAHSGGDRLGHLYYRLPAGVVSTGWGAPCPGVDLLRHGHRYSIVAPSIHPSGTVYAWAPPGQDHTDSGIVLPGPGDLPELPAAWVDYLGGEGESVAQDGPKPERERRDEFGTVGDPIPSGSHQDHLFRYACSLRQRGVPEEEAAALVRLRARQDCRPPWAGPDDAWDAVAHAYKRYEAGEPPSTGPALTLVGAPIGPTVGTSGDLSTVAARPTFLDWHALASTPQEDIDWLVPGIIAPKRGHVLYAPTGIGKSLITLEWCVAMVRGGRTVLYVDHENDPRGDVWDRLRDMDVSPDELAGLRYLSFPEMAPLDTPAGGAELVSIAQEVAPDITVVDTATRTVKGEENSNDTWTAWDRYTGVQLRKLGIAFLRIDHSGKNIERGQRGGSNKSTDADLVWQLAEVKKDEEYALTNEKARIKVPEKVIQLRRLRDPLRHEKIPVPTALETEAAIQRAIWIQMDEAGFDLNPHEPNGNAMGVNKLAKKAREAGIRGSDKFLASVMKVRWACLHNYPPAPRPEWAPGAPDLTVSEESA